MHPLSPMSPTDVPVATSSSFRDMLVAARLDSPRRILDVGAGGFIGRTTTVHLLDLFDAEVTGVEINAKRAEALAERFGDQLKVVNTEIEAFETDVPFDLVVIDLDSPFIPGIFDSLLEGKILELLAPGGVVVTLTVTDLVRAFNGSAKSLNPDNDGLIRTPLERRFGTTDLSDATFKHHYQNDPTYRAIVAVDKYRDEPTAAVGWLMLQRRDTEAA